MKCHTGLTLQGQDIVTCLATGEWDLSPLPKCIGNLYCYILYFAILIILFELLIYVQGKQPSSCQDGAIIVCILRKILFNMFLPNPKTWV